MIFNYCRVVGKVETIPKSCDKVYFCSFNRKIFQFKVPVGGAELTGHGPAEFAQRVAAAPALRKLRQPLAW